MKVCAKENHYMKSIERDCINCQSKFNADVKEVKGAMVNFVPSNVPESTTEKIVPNQNQTLIALGVQKSFTKTIQLKKILNQDYFSALDFVKIPLNVLTD